ncbi:sigma-54 interaction domain-containing protein [Longitalea arenae]|uniref:sigma-54 interaction domain-containing protein n=1 Tax=Longitalea arenae TaxID=2812558 RepID=UPI0019678C2E|nr:sigma-54 dependent transcriptional regulator [Longitalea arenae]
MQNAHIRSPQHLPAHVRFNEKNKPVAQNSASLQHHEMIGESLATKKTLQLIAKVAPSTSTVLILGETGTGKELIARAIHNNSPRHDKPMIRVNCGALPANLIESELFGHEKGSFTGAHDRRIGKFELAHQGTIFLDEIGEMPLELQVKLLRVLQEKELERIGGNTSIKVDVRIIAATNRVLEDEVEAGNFRPDLYYRLNVFPIQIEPLRNRVEDIPLLAWHFIQQYAKRNGRFIRAINEEAMEMLTNYNWPGNIRQLEHVIELSVLLTEGDIITHIHIPSTTGLHTSQKILLKTIAENEREHILRVLKYCQGRIAGNGGAASILGVPPTTLHSKLKRLGITRIHF